MEFNSLEEIYAYLETDVETLKRDWEFTSAVKRLADKISNETIKQKLKWECFVFDFYIQNGLVKPMTSGTKEDGVTTFSYPSFEDFGVEGFEYLKERINNVKSNFLATRYNHILWNSPAPYKHQQYAKKAVDAYLRILKNLNCINEEKKNGRNCLEIMKNGFSVAIEAKYKIEEFKQITQVWLFRKNKFPQELKIFILQYMLELPQFKKDDYKGTLELVKRIGTAHNRKITDYFFTKEIYETGLKIARRTGDNTKIWNKRIGDAIIKMANHRMDDQTRIVPLSFLKEAIPYYKLAGLENNVKKTEQRYFELKKELKLSKYQVPLAEETAEELEKYLEAKTAKLLEQTPQNIYGYLLSGGDIFPHKEWLVQMNKNRNGTFLDFVTTMRFDINNNVSKEKNKSEKETGKIYETYHLYLTLYVLPFLHRMFIDGIRRDKINFPTLMGFLINHTWLGQELTDYDSGGDLIKYTWLSLIAPSLHEYFLQTESALRSNNPYTNYVMPIDSLVLKFEGVLRDFSRVLKISTTVTGKGNVLREKYIEELLADTEFQKYFDENDLLFFKFLFVAKEGMNLRNNIAHCFYRFSNYNFQIMHLLICAFLRIGKYKLRVSRKTS